MDEVCLFMTYRSDSFCHMKGNAYTVLIHYAVMLAFGGIRDLISPLLALYC